MGHLHPTPAATDFFTVEVLTLAGLVRHFVLFVIEIETRRVQVAGIVRQPHGTWMKQVVDGLTATRLEGDFSLHPAHRRGGPGP